LLLKIFNKMVDVESNLKKLARIQMMTMLITIKTVIRFYMEVKMIIY